VHAYVWGPSQMPVLLFWRTHRIPTYVIWSRKRYLTAQILKPR